MVLTNYKPHTADEVSLELTAQIIQEQKDKTRVVVEQQVRESLCAVWSCFLGGLDKNINRRVSSFWSGKFLHLNGEAQVWGQAFDSFFFEET